MKKLLIAFAISLTSLTLGSFSAHAVILHLGPGASGCTRHCGGDGFQLQSNGTYTCGIATTVSPEGCVYRVVKNGGIKSNLSARQLTAPRASGNQSATGYTKDGSPL